MYISLKEGWFPLSDLCIKYHKDKGNMSRMLERIHNSDKEKVGNTWVIKESEFIKNIKTDVSYEKSTIEEINEIVDKFTNELSKKINVNIVKAKFSVEHFIQGDYIIKALLEWTIKCQIIFPIELYNFLEEEELYTKCLLVQQLWNKTLTNSKIK